MNLFSTIAVVLLFCAAYHLEVCVSHTYTVSDNTATARRSIIPRFAMTSRRRTVGDGGGGGGGSSSSYRNNPVAIGLQGALSRYHHHDHRRRRYTTDKLHRDDDDNRCDIDHRTMTTTTRPMAHWKKTSRRQHPPQSSSQVAVAFPCKQTTTKMTTTTTPRQQPSTSPNTTRGSVGGGSSTSSSSSMAMMMPPRPLSFGENMICGAVSRSIAQTMMHPMNTAKTILQNARGPDRPTLKTLIQPTMFRRLTCGAGANFVLSIPHGAVNFAVLEFVRGRLNTFASSMPFLDDRKLDALGPGLDFLSSAISTISCSIVSTPQMMITDNIMAGNYPNLLASAQGLYSNNGVIGFYAGWWPGLVGKIPSYALTWTFFQQLKRMRNVISDRPAKNYENTIMGCMGSAATVCIMIPMDTIKTRLVTQSSRVAIAGVPYKGIIDCAMRIAQEEGIKTFYRGLAPRLISVVPMIGIQFGVYEGMKRALLKRDAAKSPMKRERSDKFPFENYQYGTEEAIEEAAMEVAASGSNSFPAPHFRKHASEVEKKKSFFGLQPHKKQ